MAATSTGGPGVAEAADCSEVGTGCAFGEAGVEPAGAGAVGAADVSDDAWPNMADMMLPKMLIAAFLELKKA
jgi:hypothetical protein